MPTIINGSPTYKSYIWENTYMVDYKKTFLEKLPQDAKAQVLDTDLLIIDEAIESIKSDKSTIDGHKPSNDAEYFILISMFLITGKSLLKDVLKGILLTATSNSDVHLLYKGKAYSYNPV